MRCPETTSIHQLLAGTLSPSATRNAMDHTRVCPACRSLLLGTSEMLVSPRGGSRSSDVARPMPDIPADAPSSRPYLVETEGPAGKAAPPKRRFFRLGPGSKRTVMTLAIVAAIGWSLKIKLPDGGRSISSTPKEILIDSAIRDGMPYWEAPVGHVKTRPKVIRVILPRGNDHFEMHVLAPGEPERTMTFKNDEENVTFEDSRNIGPEGPFPCVETMIPFPDEDAFHFEPGKTYFIWAVLANGCASIPMRLTLKPR